MAFRRRYNQITGIYRTSDDISNFKIKVTFKTIISFIKIPQFHTNALECATSEAKSDDTEVIELGWQEKRLSFKEIQAYQFEENCKNDLERKYNQLIKRKHLDAGGKLPGKIFTYTAEDGFQPSPEPDDATSTNRKFGTTLDILMRGFETFYVLVDLNVEIVIISISWRKSDGLLVIYPDFNDMTFNPFVLEVDADTRQMYYFAVENISPAVKHASAPLSLRQHRPKLLSETFINSAHIMMDIQQGSGFEYDNLHVKFDVCVPYTTEVTYGSLHGSTNSSYATKGRWRFSYCHEIGLECLSNFRIDDFLDFKFTVVAIDEWQRERMEGEGTLRIAGYPAPGGGRQQYKVNCYRVLEGSMLERLERMFIGDRKSQLDLEVKRMNHVEKESRYGIETISTGSLDVVIAVIYQNKSNGIVNA